MKQFVKALNREIDCFAYLCERLRAGIFDGSQIQRSMQDKYFQLIVTTLEKNA